ncbi:MAG: zf-TFIIB domain-containing protein [Phycisphaerae bacterium]
MKCVYCSTMLSPSATYCTKCGASVNGRKHATPNNQHRRSDNRACPQCHERMQSIDLGIGDTAFFIERCGSCRGMFFDPGELEAVLQHYAQHVSRSEHADLKEMYSYLGQRETSAESCHDCPVCHRCLEQRHLTDRGGITIQTCNDHGTWISGYDVAALLSWAESADRLVKMRSVIS